jgi:hypothetical protein
VDKPSERVGTDDAKQPEHYEHEKMVQSMFILPLAFRTDGKQYTCQKQAGRCSYGDGSCCIEVIQRLNSPALLPTISA